MGNTSSTTTLRRLLEDVADELSALSPRDVPLPEVPDLLDAFCRLERLGASGRLLLAARAAGGLRWKREGFTSPAEWLAARTGTPTGRARDDLEASERLAELDGVAEAVRAGDLSTDQARVIADAVAANPGAQADLLGMAADESLRELADEAARRKAEVEDVTAREHRIRRDRRCRTWTDRDGAWNLSARGSLSDGSAFLVELERLTNQHFGLARRDGVREAREAYAFDALMDMATRSHRRIPRPTATDSGDGTPSDVPSGDPPGRENLRHLALLHVDLTALVRGVVAEGEVCELPGVGPISVAAARELLGESILKLVMTRGHDVVNVTHLGRGANAAQQVALLWTRPVCSVRGCNRRARLQNDHRRPWADDRRTHLANLDPLCDHHHDRKTRAGWELVDGMGRRPFVPPTDPRHPANTRGRPNAPPAA